MTRRARALVLGVLCAGAGNAHATPTPRLRHGNPAAELARVCVRRAGAQPERARSWLARVRLAAWLPELRLGAERDLGTREAIDPQDRARYGTYTLDELRVEGRATWRLDRLAFDPEELRASRETVRLAELRQDLALTVVRLYYERQRLAIESQLEAEAAPRETALRSARIEELSAMLEALCGPAAREEDQGRDQ